MTEMERGRGSQFEPRVLDAFLALLRDRPELAVQHTEIVQDVDVDTTNGHLSAG